MLKPLRFATLFFTLAAASSPAFAALQAPADYAHQQATTMASYDMADASGQVCVPPDPQYIPSFIRAPNGEIVGVSYTIIQYEC
ncbi:hypothetical protein BJF93_09750 [Xaviernesmea oryzae]|uniref:DUF2790 domain-containing protein n=1 Tax=Xaviernesmea oryzae TaxID=464029 RepID=A0A1Q9AWP4_9HYPH|nr:hypothetical protein [Xaviernesmea oryzae]OLP59882.1 hypothetical protein BJF93_09750 [Xaviernesmea oryzae]SEK47343.1 hypothetical protein SAMN04487976_102265 [Xaviernesmea oryzae]